MPIELTIILVLLVILVAFIGFFILKRQNYNNIVELKDRQKALMEGLPTQRLEKVRQMDISGRSQDYADSLEDMWEDILAGRNITVENHLFQAEQMNERYHFKQTKDQQDLAHQELEAIEGDMVKLSDSLEELINREEANAHRIHEIEKSYEGVRKNLLENSLWYGQAVDALEDKLADMEEEFKHFDKVTSWGDHEEGRSVILHLHDMLEEMQAYLDDIPKIIDQINQDFYPQIEEIESSFDQLINEGFVFNGPPIPQEVESVEDRIQELDQLIGGLQLAQAKELAETISLDIDQIYERMEVEISAKNESDQLIPSVQKALYYLREEVRVLFFEIDRVSQSYVLIHNEADQIRELRDSVEFLEGKFDKIVDNLDNNFTAYSEALKNLNFIKSELISLNDVKNAVTDQLYGYRDEEVQLKDQLNKMERKAKGLWRRILRENLPGVPASYSEYYTYVMKLLANLSEELNRPRLKVEKIHDLIRICQEEVNKLDQETEKLLAHANLTELMAQKLYQYKDQEGDVDQAIAQSEKLFNEDYDYESSYMVVRNKLSQINPDLVQSIQDDYKEDQ